MNQVVILKQYQTSLTLYLALYVLFAGCACVAITFDLAVMAEPTLKKPKVDHSVDHSVLVSLQELRLLPYYVQTPFLFKGSFSTLVFEAKSHMKEGKQIDYRLGELFDIKQNYIDKILSKCSLASANESRATTGREDVSFFEVVKTLLHSIAVSIKLNKNYTSIVQEFKEYNENNYSNISVGDIGMGDSELWYGVPDCRIRGETPSDEVIVVYDSEEEEIGIVPDELSEGNSIEAKLGCSERNFSQIISTTIVSSFTEYHLHPSLNSAIPTLLINNNHFFICIYDCLQDVLLISDSIPLKASDKYHPIGVLALSLVVNHRYIINFTTTCLKIF